MIDHILNVILVLVSGIKNFERVVDKTDIDKKVMKEEIVLLIKEEII